MRIALVDIDSTIPNLALMKLSAFHKAQGDKVGFFIDDPDIVYISCIYRKNARYIKTVQNSLAFIKSEKKIKWVYGGSGLNDCVLPLQLELSKPDYDLYPSTYSQGFTSRGCPRKCGFCVVPKKEGKFQRMQHPVEFHDDRFDTIMLMDNNILYDFEWFQHVVEWIIDKDLTLIEHGMDIRYLDESRLQYLVKLKLKKNILLKFAFDNISIKNIVLTKLDMLAQYFDLRHKIMFYVYMDNDTDSEFDSALTRINILRNAGTNAFLMYNIDRPRSQRVKDLGRWCNRKNLYWKMEFAEYKR